MYRLLIALVMWLSASGCVQEWDAEQAQPSRSEAVPQALEGLGQSSTHGARSPSGNRAHRLASLPDRGVLLAFDAATVPFTRSAYRSYPVRLSEEHAFATAVPGGRIGIPTPDGELLRIDYAQRIEHADGNWTWIGRNEDGLEAILTFGDNAVFGAIRGRGNTVWQVTSSGGRTWLVAIDTRRVRSGANANDVLSPHASGNGVVVGKRAGAATKTTAGVPSMVVDLLLGYTPGLVAQYGSPSAVVTALHGQVDAANFYIGQSLIAPHLRLVATLQVEYPDASSHQTLLEQLTGRSCTTSGCVDVPVPAALQALRDAREQYGADLVSIVRPYRTPEQDGCGASWLIGEGGAPIDAASAVFGYSAVAIGRDVNENDGNTYQCAEDFFQGMSLAHAIGHNLGQAHNIEDSPLPGAHPYAYGYRDASGTGIHTIMALPIPGSMQRLEKYFSNPYLYIDDRPPLGTATSDNARSMAITMPLVARFRLTVVPLPSRFDHDFNADGYSDLLWFHADYAAGNHAVAIWSMLGPTVVTTSGAPWVGSDYRIAGGGDFDGDGFGDILWVNNADSTLHMWLRRGGDYDKVFVARFGTGWDVSGVGDFNGDGRSDVLWSKATPEDSPPMAMWFMDGAVRQGSIVAFGVVLGVGELSGDGRDDIVYKYRAGSTQAYVMTLNPAGDVLSQFGFSWPIPEGSPAAVVDMDGDGRSDLVWEDPARGVVECWMMLRSKVRARIVIPVEPGYRIVASGDFDGDGFGDLMWNRVASDELYLWRGRGDMTFDFSYVKEFSAGWTIVR